MVLLGMIVGGFRVLSHLAHAYGPPDGSQRMVGIPSTRGLCSGIAGTLGTVAFQVENSLSGFDDTTSGMLDYSVMVLGHGMVSNVATLFFGDVRQPRLRQRHLSVHGYTVYGFTDLVLHLVREDPDNTGILEQSATTTDIIVAPKYELILWSDAHLSPIPEPSLMTKDLIVAPAFELAVWVPQNTCLICEAPRPQAQPVLLDAAPRVPELELHIVGLTLGTAAQVSGHGLFSLSVITTSWYNTGIGCGPIIPIHITNYHPPASGQPRLDPGSEDLSDLSDEALEREIAELMRAMAEHDANIDRLQRVLSQVERPRQRGGRGDDRLALAQARWMMQRKKRMRR
ncbi:uncharacterized protein B0H18DRAFT_982826, partial [Fomitopsis serialis]|uniref:uncharacterized protein n=1 Tax=Fomitopsis serialis TaxID=139415 RepID=UPI002008B329